MSLNLSGLLRFPKNQEVTICEDGRKLLVLNSRIYYLKRQYLKRKKKLINEGGFSHESNLKPKGLPFPVKRNLKADFFPLLHSSSIMKFHLFGAFTMSAVRHELHNKISNECLIKFWLFNAFLIFFFLAIFFIWRYILSKISLGFFPHQMKILSIINNLLADVESRETLLIAWRYSKWQKRIENYANKDTSTYGEYP